MKYRAMKVIGFGAAALAVGLLSAALTMGLSGRAAKGRVVMSAEEYDRFSRYAAMGELAERIESEYYAQSPGTEELMAGAARGMVDTLGDPYARYYTAGEYEEYLANINGEYFGLGMLIAQPDGRGAEVIEVYDGSPAQAAGVTEGDVILLIGEEPAANLALEELQSLIAAGQEQGVALTLMRGEEQVKVTLTGAEVQVNQVEHYLFNQRTGYIAITMFTGSCAGEFEAAVEELTERGMKSLVIDLRDNPGGSLELVAQVADVLLGQGMRIVSVGKGDSPEEMVYDAGGPAIAVPVAVLVNENSASASEILAAAIQENGVGVVVGAKTYGKGVVQTTMYIEAMGGWLKLTTDAYYTPDGNDINGVGVTPDIYSQLPEEYRDRPLGDVPQSEDTQLWDALDYVRKAAGG